MVQPITWAICLSRTIRFFQSGVNEIKVYEEEIETNENHRLLNDSNSEDDFSDNESTHKYIRDNNNHHNHQQYSHKCHHHQEENKVDNTISATKTLKISADERV